MFILKIIRLSRKLTAKHATIFATNFYPFYIFPNYSLPVTSGKNAHGWGNIPQAVE